MAADRRVRSVTARGPSRHFLTRPFIRTHARALAHSQHIQEQWGNNRVRVMVATVAFGMVRARARVCVLLLLLWLLIVVVVAVVVV